MMLIFLLLLNMIFNKSKYLFLLNIVFNDEIMLLEGNSLYMDIYIMKINNVFFFF